MHIIQSISIIICSKKNTPWCVSPSTIRFNQLPQFLNCQFIKKKNLANVSWDTNRGEERHPHSFSMLDADEFIIWANKVLNENRYLSL